MNNDDFKTSIAEANYTSLSKLIIWSISFGTCKKFKILPLFWIEIRKEIIFKKYQWCLGYKIIQIGFIALYYHSPVK